MHLDSQLSSYFSDKMLGIVRDIVLHMKGKEKNTQDGLPEQPPGNIYKGDAALEFIKLVCSVLAIDQNVQHDVLVSSS